MHNFFYLILFENILVYFTREFIPGIWINYLGHTLHSNSRICDSEQNSQTDLVKCSNCLGQICEVAQVEFVNWHGSVHELTQHKFNHEFKCSILVLLNLIRIWSVTCSLNTNLNLSTKSISCAGYSNFLIFPPPLEAVLV